MVVKLLYPIPEFITTVSVKTPSVIIGLIIAPVPPPVDSMTILGNELYCDPWLTTTTSSIFPLLIIGLISASFPSWIVIAGFTWWFNIVEPYWDPFSYKYAPVNWPFTTGVKLIVPVTVEP